MAGSFVSPPRPCGCGRRGPHRKGCDGTPHARPKQRPDAFSQPPGQGTGGNEPPEWRLPSPGRPATPPIVTAKPRPTLTSPPPAPPPRAPAPVPPPAPALPPASPANEQDEGASPTADGRRALKACGYYSSKVPYARVVPGLPFQWACRGNNMLTLRFPVRIEFPHCPVCHKPSTCNRGEVLPPEPYRDTVAEKAAREAAARSAKQDDDDAGPAPIDPETLAESKKSVLRHLAEKGPTTGRGLKDATGLPRRTLFTATESLAEAHLITKRPNFKDTRQSIFALVKQPTQPD